MADKKSCFDVLASAKVGTETLFETLCLSDVDYILFFITPKVNAALVRCPECRLVQFFPSSERIRYIIICVVVVHMFKKTSLLILTVFTLFLNSAFALDKTLVLGGKNGWPRLSRMDGVVLGKGKFGYGAMVLATNSRRLDSDTDILVNFEGGTVKDESGNYKVVTNAIVPSSKSYMGKYSGLALGKGGVSLSGNSETIFGKSGSTGSFLIEFWLRPAIAENGEIVFSWRSSRTVANYPLYQMITASFTNNHLQWGFTNVFNGYVDSGGEITLTSYRTIVPDQWMHHSISFDQDTGLLEYRINGLLESLKYVTTSGHETGGSIYNPVIGVPAAIDICPEYTGMIDDFRIQRTSVSEIAETLRHDTYKTDGGRFETEPILLSPETQLKKIDALVNIPAQTDIEFFVRSGDNYYNWTDSYPEWIPVKNKKDIENVRGLYFQIAAELYPDGNGKNSPSVTEMKIVYEEVPSPLPPFTVIPVSGDGQVTLEWSHSVDDTVGGYYIFYGDRPSEYLGRESSLGVSPVDVGNVNSVTVTGLKNGKIYYFAVASYSKYDSKIMGDLSKEVYARPRK